MERPATNAQQAPFVVRFDRRQQQSRIIIPRRYLPAATPAPTQSEAPQAWQGRSIFAGTLLSVVIAGGFLAVVFIRRGRFAVGVAAGLGVAAALVILGGVALADIAVPKQASPPPPVVRPATVAAHQIVVETTDSGDEVVLIVGRDGLPPGPQAPRAVTSSGSPRPE